MYYVLIKSKSKCYFLIESKSKWMQEALNHFWLHSKRKPGKMGTDKLNPPTWFSPFWNDDDDESDANYDNGDDYANCDDGESV